MSGDAVAALRAGQLVLLPTDTVYGLCADAYRERPCLRQYRSLRDGERLPNLSQEQLADLDHQVNELMREERERAANILKENRAALETLRDMLLEKKSIESTTLKDELAKPAAVAPAPRSRGKAKVETG